MGRNKVLRLAPALFKKLCAFVLQRDQYKCRSCHSRSPLQCHHIVFRSQRGPDRTWNLIALCAACHDKIHVFKTLHILPHKPNVRIDANKTVLFERT